MSFSMAEMKLVHCMNHTQFMCYALLKLFLKEVLDIKDENGQSFGLLCSYFLKTTLFWVIQSNRQFEWSPPNLLSGFWMCFKGLLSCAQQGYLPNFFIPENNMFRSKIYGEAQKLVCNRLLELRKIGIACLLHCPSVQPFFLKAILDREYVGKTGERDVASEAELEIVRHIEILRETLKCYCSYSFSTCFQMNRVASDLIKKGTNSFQGLAVELFSTEIVRSIANHMFNFPFNNRAKLKYSRSCEAILKLVVRFGCLSDTIYLALFYCISGQNKKALPILETLKKDITQPFVIHNDRIYVLAYMEFSFGGAFQSTMKKGTVTICFCKDDMIIKELEPEQKEAQRKLLQIPPYVIALMLLIIGNHGNLQKQQKVLHELHFLLHSDEGLYIRRQLRDISWQILGICQQICGDHQGALQSYQESLRQEPFHEVQKVTQWRMQDARSKI
jgi:hypothetical protein